MSSDELGEFFKALEGRFPGKLTTDQVGDWAAYIRRVPATEAMAALREYYASAKNPSDGPVPSLAGFRRCLRRREADGESGAPPTRCHPEDPVVIHTIRHRWMKQRPDLSQVFSDMSTDDIWLRHLRCCFVDALRVYGDGHKNTRQAFEEWQDFAQALGGGRIDFDRGLRVAQEALAASAPADRSLPRRSGRVVGDDALGGVADQRIGF